MEGMRIIAIGAWLTAWDAGNKGDGSSSTEPTVPSTTEPTTSPVTTTNTVDLSALALPPAGTVANGRFSTSDVCAECHSNALGADAMRDEDGDEITPYELWRSVMMANSGRDPIWREQVSAEVTATPAAAAAIEAKCLKCHAPMVTVDAALTGAPRSGWPC